MSHSQISIIDRRTGEWLPAAPDHAVLASSEALGWRGLMVEHHRLAPTEMPAHVVDQHRLLIHTGAPVVFEWCEGGRWRETRLTPGSFNLQGHGTANAPRWHQPLEFLAVGLDPAFTAHLLADDIAPERIGFVTQRGQSDARVARFGALFREELTRARFAGTLFGESLAIAFAAHLLVTYGVAGRPLPMPKGRLTGAQLGRVLDYLHANIAEDVSIETLAAQAYLSPFHFARMFKATTGESPHRFALRLRVARAQALLARPGPGLSLTEVGAAAGFFDQAHFTKSFKRIVGVVPSGYAA